jgi:hypothetical protein
MRRNPERLAWVVLITSFIVFCLTVAVVPAAAAHFVDSHTTVRAAQLDIVHGTVLVQRADIPGEQVAKDETTIEPGDSVRTAGDARAILWLFDDSNIELGPDSSVTLQDSRSSTFSDRLTSIALHLAGGKPVVSVALPGTEERQFVVRTDHGTELLLGEGAYELDLTRQSIAEAVVRFGSATIATDGFSIVCRTGQRAEIRPGAPPAGPLPLYRNLLVNGDFREPVGEDQLSDNGWKAGERGREGNKGYVEIVRHPDGNYLRFNREGTGHCENYVVQVLHRDVGQFRSLKLEMEVRLVEQSLGGGGVAGTEYPFHLRLLYRDAQGREGRVHDGLYFQNIHNHPAPFGQLALQNEWVTYSLDLTRLDPRPATLIYLELVASGWDYESHIRNVRLVAE